MPLLKMKPSVGAALIIFTLLAFAGADGVMPAERARGASTDALRNALITVNTAGDAGDGDTDDGVCDIGNAEDGFTGLCTLRAAWQQADANPGEDVITFALGDGIPTISLGSGLTEMTSPIHIDGATGGATKVEIKGPGAGAGPGEDSGLFITAGGNTIRNLIINSFDGSGLILSVGTGSTLEGTWIGLDKTGAPAPNSAAGLLFDGSSDNFIGGTSEAIRNVIDAVIILDASGNEIQGNYIGTTIDGESALGTGGGISLVFGSSENTIGGPTAMEGNVISGHEGNGISILFGSAANIVSNNYIGTNKDGSEPIPNGIDGIHIADGHNNVISRNVIAASGVLREDCSEFISCDGVDLRGGSSGNRLLGNFIGLKNDGTCELVGGSCPLGNRDRGVSLHGAIDNRIGGTDDAQGNTIAYNGDDGVFVQVGTGNAIRRNTIFANGGLGIDLAPDGVTPNDEGDVDEGANNVQNFPVLSAVTVVNGTTEVEGLLRSRTGAEFSVEYFANDERDPSGFGEGRLYLGVEEVTTGEDGVAKLEMTFAGEHQNITATATSKEGNDTSEFSGRVTLVVNSTGDNPDESVDGVCHTGGLVMRDDDEEPECTLRAALQEANGDPDLSRIEFDIPGSAPHIIQVGVSTQATERPLPVVDAPVVIDGTTQPDGQGGNITANAPRIVLDGSTIPLGVNDLDKIGLHITAGNSAIRGLAITRFRHIGLLLENGGENVVAGNYVGLDTTGSVGAGNGEGLRIENAGDNVIGGIAETERNVISGNTGHGMRITGPESTGNRVWGNFVGTDASGRQAVGNSALGANIRLDDGASRNEVGGPGAGERNVISGNRGGIGLSLAGTDTQANRVRGNYIGTDVAGEAPLGNGSGVSIRDALSNEIGGAGEGEGNLIADNGIGVDISGTEAAGNKVWGNLIGTDRTGSVTDPDGTPNSGDELGNSTGVNISDARDNEIGGVEPARGNVIVGSSNAGITIMGLAAAGNIVRGNYVGVADDGLRRLRNNDGILLFDGAHENVIGGLEEGAGNVISGNLNAGLRLFGSESAETRDNIIQGNFIGTDKTGEITDPDGTPNSGDELGNGVGVQMRDETHGNVIGGLADGAGNVISGNLGDGIFVATTAQSNRVQGNAIGANRDGTMALGNGGHGVRLEASGNVVGNPDGRLLGQPCANGCNVVSGNGMSGVIIWGGVTENVVAGNFIGTDVSGTAELANEGAGVVVENTAFANRIGGLRQEEGPALRSSNLISGNAGDGIRIEQAGTNSVQGNFIGTTEAGTEPLPNQGDGIKVTDGENNTLGNERFGYDPNSVSATSGNRIAFNARDGVRIEASGPDNGANNAILTNSIFSNGGLGINLGADDVTPNDLGDNDGGANRGQNFPRLVRIERAGDDAVLNGTLATDGRTTDYVIEYFASAACDASNHGEGAGFLASRLVTTGSDGQADFSHTLPAAATECAAVTATATDPQGNTSEFSECIVSRRGCLVVADIRFDHEPFDDAGTWIEFDPQTGTTDGNPVRVRSVIANRAETPLDADVWFRDAETNQLLPAASGIIPSTFPAGDTVEVPYRWDTRGYAWNDDGTAPKPNSDRLVRVVLRDEQGEEIHARQEEVQVLPRPVVMAHGLWSSAALWETYKTDFLPGAHPGWIDRGFAVGDTEGWGTMNTGSLPGSNAESMLEDVTIAENAARMGAYIENVRARTGAHHVDLVAHSMGGLISRYYLDNVMPMAPDVTPVVSHLIMMGTPNRGSTCPEVVLAIMSSSRPGALDLLVNGLPVNVYQNTRGFLDNEFNPRITNRHGVPFYIWAGDSVPVTCLDPFAGDEVVTVFSAMPRIIKFAQRETGSVRHTAMGTSRQIFDTFVVRILDNGPADPARKNEETPPFPVAANGESLPSPVVDDGEEEEGPPQFVATELVQVPRGGRVEVEIPVPEAAHLGVTVIAPSFVGSALHDEAGAVVNEVRAHSSDAEQLYRNRHVNSPSTGMWHVALVNEDTSSATTVIPVAAWVRDTPVTFDLDARWRPSSGGSKRNRRAGQIEVGVSLADHDDPLVGADLTAGIVGPAGAEFIELDLVDDGEHGDGEANDGVYGGVTAALPAGGYSVGVEAEIGGASRFVSRLLAVGGPESEAGINLFLTNVGEPHRVGVGEMLAYALTTRNLGPETATGVLLSTTFAPSLEVISVSAEQGTCTTEAGALSCEIGSLASGTDVTVTMVVRPSEVGSFTHTASATANETDWDTSNNTSVDVIEVVTSTGTDDSAEDRPAAFRLYPNYPNPFNPTTTFRFEVKDPAHVVLKVYDILGQDVATPVDGTFAPGRHLATFDGGHLSSGVYFYRVRMGESYRNSGRMILSK